MQAQAIAVDPEVELMLAFQRGEESAFVELYRSYRDRIVNFARRMVGDQARAEDAAQDVFLKLYGARASYQPRSRFSTFIFRIATNHCLNLRAKKSSQPTPELDEGAHAGTASSPEDDASRQRLKLALTHALGTLPANQRAALVLCHYEGMSYREAAEALDVSEPAIKSLIHRARGAVSELLAPWMREP